MTRTPVGRQPQPGRPSCHGRWRRRRRRRPRQRCRHESRHKKFGLGTPSIGPERSGTGLLPGPHPPARTPRATAPSSRHRSFYRHLSRRRQATAVAAAPMGVRETHRGSNECLSAAKQQPNASEALVAAPRLRAGGEDHLGGHGPLAPGAEAAQRREQKRRTGHRSSCRRAHAAAHAFT